MTDPAAIDLEPYKRRVEEVRTTTSLGHPAEKIIPGWAAIAEDLIAAVEALRERVAEQVTDPAAIDSLTCACRFRTVEGAIKLGSETGELVDPDVPIHECDLHKALRERARAKDWVVHTARLLMAGSSSGPFRGDGRQRMNVRDALAKLDALDQEDAGG